MPPPPSLRVTATYNAPVIAAIGFALPDAGDTLFTLERTERGARVVERDTRDFAERASWGEPELRLSGSPWLRGVSPDGAVVVVHDDEPVGSGLRFVRLRDGATWVAPDMSHWERVAWSRDGRTLLGSSRRGHAWVDVASGAVVDREFGSPGEFSADNAARFVRARHDGASERLSIDARANRRELASWALPPRAARRWCPADASLDALWCAVSDGDRHELRRYSLDASEVPAVALGEPWVGVFARGDECAVLTASGRVARVAREGGTLALRWLPPSTVPLPFVPWYLGAASTDGRRAVVHLDRRFAVVDLDTGEARAPATLAASATGTLAASRDGRRVAVAMSDGAVAVLDAVTLRPEATFELDPRPEGLAFAPDGRTLHAWDGAVWTALDLRDGSTHVVAELPQERRGEETALFDGDVSPDGRFGVLANDRASEGPVEWLRVDLARGLTSWVVSPREGSLHALRYAADGRVVAGLSTAPNATHLRTPALVRCDADTGALLDDVHFFRDRVEERREATYGASTALLAPGGAFAFALYGGPYNQRGRAFGPAGAVTTAASLRDAVVLGLSPTRVALYGRWPDGPDAPMLSVLEAATLAEVAQEPWVGESGPRWARFLGDDALAVVCDDGRLVRLEIDAAR
ncbi:MAG: hypothetical protein U0324_46080 [Polyangiales bacterium]